MCISCTHSHEPPWRQHVQEHTYPNTHAAHSCPQTERKTRTKSGYVRTCAHTHNRHTCLHLGAFSRSSSTPAGLKAIHVDTHTSTRSAKTSVYLLHTRPAAPTPRCMQLICVHTHPAAPTPVHAAHTRAHTHSCVQLCTHSYPLYTHKAQLYTRVHKLTFTYAHIRQVHSGSHTSPYPVHKTYLHKYT